MKSPLSLYLLVALCYVQQATFSNAQGVTDEGLRRNFQEVNEYLVENFGDHDGDPEADMIAIDKWLKLNPSGVSETFVDALKLLNTLKVIQGTKFCNGHSLEIKSSINDAMKGGKRQLNRVGDIVQHYFEQHAKGCATIYLSMYKEKSSQLDENTVKLSDDLLNQAIKMYTTSDEDDELETSKGLLDNFIINYRPFETRVVYNTIVNQVGGNLAKSDIVSKKPEEKKMELHEEKLLKLYQNNIVDPCQRFVALLGSDVFEPIAFDHLFYKQVFEGEFEFYRAWAKYQVCNTVVSQEEKWANWLVSLTKRIVANL